MPSESTESSTVQATTPTEDEPREEASLETDADGTEPVEPEKEEGEPKQEAANGFRPLHRYITVTFGDALPQWPFRGVVQAFLVDEDGDGDRDLVLQFHDSTTRSTTEAVIFDTGYGLPEGLPSPCYHGLRYNSEEIWVADWYALVSVPWGGTTVTIEQSAASQRVPLSPVDYPGTTLRAAGSRFSAEPVADGVRLTAGDAAATYRMLPEPDQPAGSGEPYRYLRFRGTDGELLALTLEQGDDAGCSGQLTAVVSLRTGGMVACGRHAGDIQLIAPPDTGLAVEQVVLPEGDVLAFNDCDLSLEQARLKELPAGSLFDGLESMPVTATVQPPRCHPGRDADPVVLGDALPAAPFYGAALVRQFYDNFCGRQVVEVRLHDARTRSTKRLTIPNASQISCASHILPTSGGLEFYVHERGGPDWQIRTNYYRIELPWGGQGTASPAAVHRGRPSIDHFSSTPKMSWHDQTTLSGTAIEVQSHTNGVRLVAGETVAGYALSPEGSPGPPEQTALMGRHRLAESYVSLEGTDGELVAFSWNSSPEDCTPKDTYVISMRSGELIACGTLLNGDLLLIAPEGGGLLVDGITLPPSGWLDKGSCPNGLGDELFAALEDRPAALSPFVTASPPDQVALPTTIAPGWPFHGVVRAYERYEPSEYRHDLIVQYYRTDEPALVEVGFDETQLAGLVRDFFVAELGVAVARDSASGERIVVPWGEAPRLITARAASAEGWQPRRGVLPRYPTSLLLGDSRVEIAGYEPWPVGMINLSHNGTERWYLTSPSPEPRPTELKIERGEQSPAWTAHLRGTDGNTLALTYLHEYFDDCVSVCGLELTYLISLATGDVLACGVETRHSPMAFVMPPDVRFDAGAFVLPPSGWLDPEPCLRGPPAGAHGCSILVHEHEPETLCVREFDLRATEHRIEGASVAAATIAVRPSG